MILGAHNQLCSFAKVETSDTSKDKEEPADFESHTPWVPRYSGKRFLNFDVNFSRGHFATPKHKSKASKKKKSLQVK